MYDVDVIFILELSPHTRNGEIIQRTAINSEGFFASSGFSFNFHRIVFGYFGHEIILKVQHLYQAIHFILCSKTCSVTPVSEILSMSVKTFAIS